MEHFTLGFITGLSLILALGAQNIFVIEQGLKREYIFTVCMICSLSDLILIFLGIFLFEYFKFYFTEKIIFLFNILLLIFLIYFIYTKIKYNYRNLDIDLKVNKSDFKNIILKTLGFTYLNPHVYSDTVFFLGNFSKNFLLLDKYLFGIGASLASLIFFFSLGYLSRFFSGIIFKTHIWKLINYFIISFMSVLAVYVFLEIINFY